MPDHYVWLSTNNDAHTLSDIRKAPSTGPLQLTPLSDRQAIMHNLEADPLNLELIGNLILGAIASLFLTWLGCLVASWMNASQRALSFGILRALGSTPQ
ncbi:MAG TPA: hypothetical protein VGN34_14765 [Ktedonobacteraceae bacterium]